MQSFGDLIRHHRQLAGLSQRQLAEKMGVSSAYVADVEHGNRPPFDKARILQAAEALGVEAWPLFQVAMETRERITIHLDGLGVKERETVAMFAWRVGGLGDRACERILKILEEA